MYQRSKQCLLQKITLLIFFSKISKKFSKQAIFYPFKPAISEGVNILTFKSKFFPFIVP